LTSFAVENFLLCKEFDKSFGFPHWLVSFHYQKYQSVKFIHGLFASATKNSISIELANHFFPFSSFQNSDANQLFSFKASSQPRVAKLAQVDKG
jgi:hypothetical protein